MIDGIITNHCSLEDADDLVPEMSFELDLDWYEVPAERNRTGDKPPMIEVDGARVIVPQAGYSLRYGEYLYYDDEEGDYVSDYPVVLVYEKDEADPSEFLYWERDTMPVVLYNYMRDKGKQVDLTELTEYPCEIEFEVSGV